MRIADDETDAGQRRNFFGGALRVAASHHDSCFGILPAHAADRGARILVRARRNGAGIHDHHGRFRRSGGASHPALLELAFEGGAVSLRGAAAKVLYVVSGHDPMVPHPLQSPQKGNVKGRGRGRPRDIARADQAEAAVRRDIKHSRQKTGRPCVGRKGTVVCFPHPEQVAWVSTLV